jgi:DNA primase
MPSALQRAGFAADARELGIDSAILRGCARPPPSVESVAPAHDPPADQRILLRALVLPDSDPARTLASTRLAEHPEWYDGLPSSAILGPLPSRPLRPTLSTPRPGRSSASCWSALLSIRSSMPMATPPSRRRSQTGSKTRSTLEHRHMQRRHAGPLAHRRSQRRSVTTCLKAFRRLLLDRRLRDHNGRHNSACYNRRDAPALPSPATTQRVSVSLRLT